jgi:heme-degrading monooxygenase HmoA
LAVSDLCFLVSTTTEEVAMFARSVSIHLKRNSAGEFIRVFEDETIPLLRRQEGFKDVMSLISPDGKDVVVVSVWGNKTYAEAYQRHGFADVLETLHTVLEGTPQVKTYEVCNSTFTATTPVTAVSA